MERAIGGTHVSAWISVAWLALAGCGGKVIVDESSAGTTSGGTTTTSADPCAAPTEPFDSARALELAYCQPELPATARLLAMTSSGDGDVDELGRSGVWRMTFRDDGGDHPRYRVDASTGKLEIKVGDIDLPCTGEEIDPFDSAAVMPDALARFAEHDPYEGGYAPVFITQTAACTAQYDVFEGQVVAILRNDPQAPPKTPPAYWFVSYTGDNTFVKLCGPCKMDASLSCMPCFE